MQDMHDMHSVNQIEKLEKPVLLRRALDVLGKVLSVLNALGGACIVLSMLFVFVDVILRRFFTSPILGDIEVVQILAAVIVYFGFGYNAFFDGHIKVDLIKRWPAMDYVTDAISIITVTWFVKCAYVSAVLSAFLDEGTKILGFPLAVVKYFIVFGFVVLDLGLIGHRLQKILDDLDRRRERKGWKELPARTLPKDRKEEAERVEEMAQDPAAQNP
jgi:TRAP-type C4-dicarboxylate transport system permease small subunit